MAEREPAPSISQGMSRAARIVVRAGYQGGLAVEFSTTRACQSITQDLNVLGVRQRVNLAGVCQRHQLHTTHVAQQHDTPTGSLKRVTAQSQQALEHVLQGQHPLQP